MTTKTKTTKIDIEATQDKIANTSINVLGYSLTPTQIGIGFGILSTIIGTLYGGFTMYQKVEEIANLDIGAYQQQMDLVDEKLLSQQKLLKSMESNLNDAKTNMYRIDTKVGEKLNNYDTKLDRFENKVEKIKTDLEDRIQKALDNPLSGRK